jgi:hypothetical protein
MANVRCKEEHSEHLNKNARSREYVARIIEPFNYPNTDVICGTVGCHKPGVVHLDEEEWLAYQQGERIFEPHTQAVEIRVSEITEIIPEN